MQIELPTNHPITSLTEWHGYALAEAGDDVFVVDLDTGEWTKTCHAFLEPRHRDVVQ